MSTAAVPAFVSGCRGHGDEPYGRRDRARQPYVVARWLVFPPRTQQSPEAVRVIALDAESGLVLDQVPPRLSRVRRYLVGMLAFVTLSNPRGCLDDENAKTRGARQKDGQRCTFATRSLWWGYLAEATRRADYERRMTNPRLVT